MKRLALAFMVAIVTTWIACLILAPYALAQARTTPLQPHATSACYAPSTTRLEAPARPVKASRVTPAAKPAYSPAQLTYVSKWTNDSKRSAKVLAAVHKVSKETGLSPKLLLAVIKPESKFNPRANSGKGDYGLMQVRVKYHRDRMKRLKVKNIHDIEQNIRLGADIIVEYRRSAKGNLKKALVRYTGGSSKQANRILRDMNRIPA